MCHFFPVHHLGIAFLAGSKGQHIKRGGKDNSNVALFRTTRLTAYTHLLSNVMPSKCFLIMTLSGCLKNKIRSRWEKLAPSYNPFFCVSQITILATARIAKNITRFSPWYGVVKEARGWRPIPLRANLPQQPAEPLHERIRSGTHQ